MFVSVSVIQISRSSAVTLIDISISRSFSESLNRAFQYTFNNFFAKDDKSFVNYFIFLYHAF